MSFKLCSRLNDLFPDSSQVRTLGMDNADGRMIWRYAGAHGFVLVSCDVDFADLATLLGPPPKVIWLRSGNQSTLSIERLLRMHFAVIAAFEDDAAACLEIY